MIVVKWLNTKANEADLHQNIKKNENEKYQ